jgi:hypothetical protein
VKNCREKGKGGIYQKLQDGFILGTVICHGIVSSSHSYNVFKHKRVEVRRAVERYIGGCSVGWS